MPQNTALAMKVWDRYAWCRDNGHVDFIEKADKCDAFFAGDQWDPSDKAKLANEGRPALTINKILSTLGNVMGEQIYNRAEISFRPKSGAPAEVADVLAKVFKHISDQNQLDWRRSDMFADGIITSRGFLDARIEFDDSMQGEVRIRNINPKNVILDPDGEEYDPDSWSEVFVTKWMTADDIEVLYNKQDADILRARDGSGLPYGFDAIDVTRNRFGDDKNPTYAGSYEHPEVTRNVRVIERQYRMLDRQKHFVSLNGDTRPIPEGFDRDKIALFVEQYGFNVIDKLVRRIRWTVVADDLVLHDDWSPYKHFTVIPYFPYFRYGRTLGLAENLLGPQELLNKVTSQELHVVNTTANSGWKIKTNSLRNMSIEELEQNGSKTGLVIEVDELDAAEKIQPNQTPQGLDRISYKAEEHIKGISGVSDSMQGFDREDVAAKAIQAKRQAGSTNLAKPLDSLVRSDFILARNVLDMVQEFYTEERLLTITHDRLTGETEDVIINQVTPEGTVVNDLTVGEYMVVISSVPQRETLEDSQFEQAVALKELGVPIPDSVLIDSSRLIRKSEIIKQIEAATNSPEAQEQRELEKRGLQAEVAKTEAEAQGKAAEAALKGAKAGKENVLAQKEAITPPEDSGAEAQLVKAEVDAQIAQMKFEHERELGIQKMEFERQKHQQKMALDAQAAADKRMNDRVIAIQKAAAAKQAAEQQAQQPDEEQ